MDAVPLHPPPAASETQCPSHPEERVLGACARCGAFFCAQDRGSVEGVDYCAGCAARPDVDVMEAFRLQSWGKRDAWASVIGLHACLLLIQGLLLLRTREDVLFPLEVLLRGAVSACFWWGLRFSRLALCLLPIGMMVLALTTGREVAVSRECVFLLVYLSIYTDLRNRLFFKEELSREAFAAAWRFHQKNTAAWVGLVLGGVSVLGLLAGFLAAGVLALLALQYSLVGLLRTRPGARAPVRWRRVAIAGLLLSGAGFVGVFVRILLADVGLLRPWGEG